MPLFQSTHPLRGATATARCSCWPKIFQSTHPLRGATWRPHAVRPGQQQISIHAPLAGCDPRCPSCSVPPINFNPRTPCGVRPKLYIWTREAVAFQSTHPLRGATLVMHGRALLEIFQSTHPLRGATYSRAFSYVTVSHFNPRTPCGVRQSAPARAACISAFQSTHPLRGATYSNCYRA